MVPLLVLWPLFEQCPAQLDTLRFKLFFSDGSARFQQLIRNYTTLVPPNTQKTFAAWFLGQAEDVEAWPDIPYVFLFRLREWIHFSPPTTMWWKNPFLFAVEQLVTGKWTTLYVSRLQIIKNRSLLYFNHSQRIQSLEIGLAGGSYCWSKVSLRLARLSMEQCLQFRAFKGSWPSFTPTVVSIQITVSKLRNQSHHVVSIIIASL